MLHFKNQPWMLRHGVSHIAARIGSDAADPSDVFWMLKLWYVNRAACWRRVTWTRRPNVELSLHGFQPPQRSWRSLEHANYWNLAEEQWFNIPHGWVDLTLVPGGYHKPVSGEIGLGCSWRICKRDGAIFTVELSVPSKDAPPPPVESESILVTADGSEEQARDQDDYWRNHAMLYLVEDVPFGVVTVQVPRNVADPIAYATARARHFLQVPEQPERIDIHDHADSADKYPSIAGDLYVHLHYHGYHSD